MHIGNWFHHLFNPHCPECVADKECNTCHELREQLVHERNQNRELVKALVELTKPEKEVVYQSLEPHKPLQRNVPWPIRRAQLEEEDRRNAQVTAQKQEETAKLEKELGISNAG